MEREGEVAGGGEGCGPFGGSHAGDGGRVVTTIVAAEEVGDYGVGIGFEEEEHIGVYSIEDVIADVLRIALLVGHTEMAVKQSDMMSVFKIVDERNEG